MRRAEDLTVFSGKRARNCAEEGTTTKCEDEPELGAETDVTEQETTVDSEKWLDRLDAEIELLKERYMSLAKWINHLRATV